jgi:magnesium transporter
MYDQDIMLSAAIGITMMAVVVIAKSVGCTLPLVAKKLGLDPAIMAAPLISTILDTCTILVYFNIVTTIFHLRSSRQSPNGNASICAWLVARGNKFP